MKKRVMLISAPAGYDKSTLASRWIAACDSPGGWVSLDKSDSGPRMFMSYVLAAIRSLFPRTELRTNALPEANQLPSVPVLAHLEWDCCGMGAAIAQKDSIRKF